MAVYVVNLSFVTHAYIRVIKQESITQSAAFNSLNCLA